MRHEVTLRRAGTQKPLGPGSAAHGHSVSKTRVNALRGAALRPGHGTVYNFIYVLNPAVTNLGDH